MCHVPQRYYLGPFGEVNVETNINRCPLDDPGCISPMKSNPHPLNGHGFIIEFITPA
jgi:hypothetical protein